MPDDTVAAARGVTRREFLNYVWGAAMALFMAEMGGAIFLVRSASLQGRRVWRHIQRAGVLAAQAR